MSWLEVSIKNWDSRGVRRLTGKWRSLSVRRCVAYMLGSLFGSLMVLLAFLAPKRSQSPAYESYLIAFSFFIYVRLICFGIRSLRIRNRIKTLSAENELCQRFGIRMSTLDAMIQERDIKPRYKIDGEDYYDPRDFGEAMTLLRASHEPEALPDTLLRPAGKEQIAPLDLLRATTATAQNETTIDALPVSPFGGRHDARG